MTITQQLDENFIKFIQQQQMFFVATADTDGRVNVSPKGLDTLKVKSNNRILWLSLSGSGNETATHVQATKRMTLMFCAFTGKAMILRLYGQAKVYHPWDKEWETLINEFPEIAGSRQIFDLDIDLVQTSCGSGVPIMDFQKSRGEEELVPFYAKMGKDGVQKYWSKKNTTSIDGKATGIFQSK